MNQASLNQSKCQANITTSFFNYKYSIIILHGLGGHPYKTFASPSTTAASSRSSSPSSNVSPPPKLLSRTLRRLVSRSSNPYPQEEIKNIAEAQGSHWPRDFLPRDCPQSRIMVWGYDSRITKGYAPSNKNNIFAHAKDLLHSLRRERTTRRPIVFLAHSLGGLIVKEASITFPAFNPCN